MKRQASTHSDGLVDAFEYRWVLLASLAALALTCVPYLVGWAMDTPGQLFSGCIFLDKDCYSYLAKMRQGAEGAWLFHIAYTSEPHPGAFFFPFHLLLGKAAALLPGSDLTTHLALVYHAMRLLFGLGLLLTVYRFLAEFTPRLAVRRLAWLMVTFGGGLGWLLVALGQPNWLGTPPLDFYLPEGFAFLVLLGFPHIAAAQSLLLWGILFLLKAWGKNPKSRLPFHVSRLTFHVSRLTSHVSRLTSHVSRLTSHVSRFTLYALLSGFCWLLMGLIIPFYVGVAWAVAGVAWLALALRERRILWREGLLAGVTVLLSAPVIAYSAWVFTHDRVYGAWAAQNLILSPHPLHYLAAYGAPLLLALFAVRTAWRSARPAWLPLAWVAVAPLLAYLPFNLQRRLVEGVQVPLSLLAAWGTVRLWRSRRRWPVALLLATMLPSSVITLAGSSAWMFARPAPVFRARAEIAALDWLAGQAQLDDVVLTSYKSGNYLPVRVGVRVFLGHGLETVDADEKEAMVERFFDAATDDGWRQWLLESYSVDYVFWGPAERALGDFDPAQAAYLRQLYDAGGYSIFEVER